MTAKKRILICDDEEGIRESLKLILENDYDLIFSCNGKECLEKLECEQDVKLVLLDIKMPKQNGLEITQEIKRACPDIKIIIVTGYASPEIAQEAICIGVNDYIPKPFASKEILRKVNNLC
ncbi:response regulator of zinc sigma-54-dependent two-component system [Candidatus Velamenicoccus archaeovorus]|uniref:Response regulator of zinc sigma-54-dependent two-component system n=1 Tax=Velamenicoccus archaeovorus TaxID=1930593 RepID=A0A410P419_VELA1|nr:response regulator [Candidatus Velamenicoccus archaeovorus]QAT16831.1 response regulator of zinc sigma-54-dependent two-component system [Candidatus Velamenicoccus archaeovorus]